MRKYQNRLITCRLAIDQKITGFILPRSDPLGLMTGTHHGGIQISRQGANSERLATLRKVSVGSSMICRAHGIRSYWYHTDHRIQRFR